MANAHRNEPVLDPIDATVHRRAVVRTRSRGCDPRCGSPLGLSFALPTIRPFGNLDEYHAQVVAFRGEPVSGSILQRLDDVVALELLQSEREHTIAEAGHRVRYLPEARYSVEEGADDRTGPALPDELARFMEVRAERPFTSQETRTADPLAFLSRGRTVGRTRPPSCS